MMAEQRERNPRQEHRDWLQFRECALRLSGVRFVGACIWLICAGLGRLMNGICSVLEKTLVERTGTVAGDEREEDPGLRLSNQSRSVQGRPSPGWKPQVYSKFYAVRRGRTPGMYFSWADCSREVHGFRGAQFKSFKTLADAENYLFEEARVV